MANAIRHTCNNIMLNHKTQILIFQIYHTEKNGYYKLHIIFCNGELYNNKKNDAIHDKTLT